MPKRRANGEGNIRKRKDGRWEGRYTAGYDPESGKRIIKNVLGKTQAEVKEKLKTAKTPAKVHLRLRFQNLGKPRTAGLCGRAAGACDCGPLSCTKIERPSLSQNPA